MFKRKNIFSFFYGKISNKKIDYEGLQVNQLIFESLCALLVLNILSILYAGYWLRPFVGEGGPWFYQLISNARFSYDIYFTRYSNLILQIPALLMTKMNLSQSSTLGMLSFCYSLPSIVSLISCIFILARRKRLDLIIYPIIGFSMLGHATLSQPSLLASDILAMTWPLMLLVFLPVEGKYNLWSIALLSLAIALNHEIGAFTFLALFCLKFFEIYRFEEKRTEANYIILVIILIGGLWFAYRLFGPTAGDSSLFMRDLKNDQWLIYRKTAVPFLISFLAMTLKGPQRSRRVQLGLGILIALGVLSYFLSKIFSAKGWYLLSAAYNARVWVGPFAALICICFYLEVYRKENADSKKSYRFNCLLFVTMISLLISLLADLRATHEWAKGISYLRKTISVKSQCEEITKEDIQNNLNKNGLMPRELPILSILVSLYEDNDSLSVLTGPVNRIDNVPNACCTIKKSNFFFYEKEKPINLKGKIDFSTLIENTKNDLQNVNCN